MNFSDKILTIDGHDYSYDELARLVLNYHQLIRQLASAKSALEAYKRSASGPIVLDGKKLTSDELVEKYVQLLQENARLKQQLGKPAETTKQVPVVTKTAPQATANVDLIARYYQLVQTVLVQYQERVDQIQLQLKKCLAGAKQSEFLTLVHGNFSASAYKSLLLKRNEAIVNYLNRHPECERAVQQSDGDNDETLRGIRYWESFTDRYRQQLGELLKLNQQMLANFQSACCNHKKMALKIQHQKPNLLSTENNLAFHTIYSGLEDEEEWKTATSTFADKAKLFLKGIEGEKLVKKQVEHGGNQVLTSLNLPYEYQKDQSDSNQIDCVVVNQNGIFVLEVKNYSSKQLGIDKDGNLIADWTKHLDKKIHIGNQGRCHYRAVYNALGRDKLVKPHLAYLKKCLRVLYVSANAEVDLLPAPAEAPYYHFISLTGLEGEMAQLHGNLRPEIVREVVAALVNAQQKEKAYPYYCFPSDPASVIDKSWHQFLLINELLKLKVDDLVAQVDPKLLAKLDQAGYLTRDGYVIKKPEG